MKINRFMQLVCVSGVVSLAVPAFASAPGSVVAAPLCDGDSDDDDKDEKDDKEGETSRL